MRAFAFFDGWCLSAADPGHGKAGAACVGMPTLSRPRIAIKTRSLAAPTARSATLPAPAWLRRPSAERGQAARLLSHAPLTTTDLSQSTGEALSPALATPLLSFSGGAEDAHDNGCGVARHGRAPSGQALRSRSSLTPMRPLTTSLRAADRTHACLQHRS